MSRSQESPEYEQLAEATKKLDEATKHYHETIRQFVSVAPIVPGQAAAPPIKVLDEKGMREIDEAEALKDRANEAFKKALDIYYVAKA
jgi:hypothetical protein